MAEKSLADGRKRILKAKNKENPETQEQLVDERLPKRLFATDQYPSERFNNNHSLEYLLLVRDVLEGSDEIEMLMGSCFGHLFRLPVRRCAYSAKIIHGLLTRQLVTKKRYELWSVFGGQPTRFSLAEFGYVTGLPCGEFEPGYVIDDKAKPKKKDYVYGDKLFGGKRAVTVADVAGVLATDKGMPMSRKLKLCLILIVDGVLLATTQNPSVSLKHVNRLQNLKIFLSFPWGRESFWWTISTMIPPLKVMGTCDDPEGEFCLKLRQQTKIMAEFPLALQLWAFEAIPGLLSRLGGSDDLILINYGGEKLPQHSGLPLSAVLDVEHDPKLIVKLMVDCVEDKEEGMGEFDCEIFDRTVLYVMNELSGGRTFKKWEWGGGDSQETKYDHEAALEEKKRKKRPVDNKKEEVGPALKQRRLSRYFSRKGNTVEGRVEALEEEVARLSEVVAQLKKVVEKQDIMNRRRPSVGTSKFSRSVMRGGLRKNKRADNTGKKKLFDDDVSNDNGKSSDGEGGKDAMELQTGPSEKQEGEEVLGLKRETEVVALMADKMGGSNTYGHEVYYGSGSGPTDGQGDEVGIKKGFGVEAEITSAYPLTYVEQDGDGGGGRELDVNVLADEDAGNLDKLVVEITRCAELDSLDKEVGGVEAAKDEMAVNIESGNVGGVDGKEVGSESNKVVEGSDGMDDSTKEDSTKVVGRQGNFGKEGQTEHGAEADCADVDNEDEEDDLGGEKIVMELSDSSPCKTTKKHIPGESEADLASLLLAKEAFSLENIVPLVEDVDYPYFERVLLENPKVLHLNAGKFDLDNQFFLDLATPEKWVSTQHMEALVEYVGSRHEERLKERRSVFLPPWFRSHLQGKTRSFNAARFDKGRVLGDGTLSAFLTKEGKRWGVDVDTLYTPMIWGGDHWVGLSISLIDWRVLVLDPNPGLRDMSVVRDLMDTVTKMLPYLVKKVCVPPAEGAYTLDPFALERMAGAYENRRSGDCGPVAMKFMELHALGNPPPRMDGLTDEVST